MIGQALNQFRFERLAQKVLQVDVPASGPGVNRLRTPQKRVLQIVDMALRNNRDLRLAALNVERARALYGIQRAELLPSVDASGSWVKQRRSSDLITPGYPRTVEQYSVHLGIAAWEIDLFGRIRSLKDQALQAYLGGIPDQQNRSGNNPDPV